MKKFIAILIAALMIIPLGFVFSSAAETNIAQGMSYTFTGKYVDTTNNKVLYPDDTGKQLTDGVAGSAKDECAYSKDLWVGLNWKGENTECNSSTWSENTVSINYITVDLAAVKSSLTKFVLFATQYSDGVNKPKSVEVFVSDDGTNYSSVGTAAEALAVDAEVEGKNYGIYSYTVAPSASASARYVKFKITAGGPWTHVSEVSVFQGETSNNNPPETYSLITTDTSKWLTGKCTVGGKTEEAAVTKPGDFIVISGSTELWPYAYYNIPEAEQHKVKISDFKLSYKFTVEDGKTNIVLFCEGAKCEDNAYYVNDLTHLIVPDGQPGRDEGADDLKPGTYEGSIDLSQLSLQNGALKEEGYITISAVKVFTVGGGKITLEKMALESKTTTGESSGTSSTGGSTSSSAQSTSSSSSSSGQVKTGDPGIAVFAIITVVSLIGMSAVSLKKRR